MKKRYLFGFIAIILAFALAFTGGDFSDDGVDPDDGGNTEEPLADLSIKVADKDNIVIETIFSTKRTKAAVMSPMSDDTYRILQGTNEVSKGSITVSGNLITFTSNSDYGNKTFGAVMFGSGDSRSLNYPEGIPNGQGTISFNPINVTNPAIAAHPVSTTVALGGTITTPLSVTMQDGGGTLSYQWYGGASSSSMTVISGATGSSYSNPPTTTVGTRYYYVSIANTSGGFTKSSSAKVTVTSGATGGGDISNSLSPDAGGELVNYSGNTTIITGPVKAANNIVIPYGNTVRVISSAGSAKGKLSIPDGITVTVNGKLAIESDGTLNVDGSLIVASGGLFDISADKTADSNSNKKDGILSGHGTITIDGGVMNLPDLNKYNLSSVSGNIDVKTGGELFLVSGKDSSFLYTPFIGKSNSQSYYKSGANDSTGSDFVLTEGYITLAPRPVTVNSTTATIGFLYLSGKATVMGRPDTVDLSSPFTLLPNSTLTIGGTKASTLHIKNSTSGTDINTYIDIIGNSTVILTTGSSIKADAVNGVKGTNIRKGSGNGNLITSTDGKNWINPASTQ